MNSNRNLVELGRRGRGGRGRGRGHWRGDRQPGRHFGDDYNHHRNRSEGFRGSRQGNQWPKRFRQEAPTQRLHEKDIGVTEYLSSHDGFTGIIKSRYADFQVSEINEDGVVAKLTDQCPPNPPEEEQIEEDEELILNKYNLEVLPLETWDKINKLTLCKEATDEVVEVDATGMTKEQRTKIHDTVKKAFGDIIVSSTVNQGDKKYVVFQRYRKGVRIDTRVKWVWPAEYVHFIVHKENCDTMEAASRIAERMHLGIKPSMLGYAGTKDRRAKTSQWFSLRKVDPRKLAAACRQLRDIRLGNFSFHPHTLRLGMLQGNQFRIALRNVTADSSIVSAACSELAEKGFINYYGLQRFGTQMDTPTHKIGLHLLRGEFKEAIDLILRERPGPTQQALRVYRESGAGAAHRVWPRRLAGGIEGRLLRALAAYPKDLVGALSKLARNSRLLYLHAYQSHVWNRCVSERIQRLGRAPAVGDLVPCAHASIKEEIECLAEDEADESETDSQNGDQDKMADAELPRNSLETSIKQTQEKIPVKELTQEDVDSGKYKLSDIVMPLPGFLIEYPPNMKDYYEEILSKDGLTLEMKHRIKSYSLSGAYRFICVRPTGVKWELVRYSDPYCDLILSDWDELLGHKLTGISEDGKYGALLLTLTLPASCYATMALRELLKMDTSGSMQAQQNTYHLEDGGRTLTVPPVVSEDKAESSEVKVEVKEESAEKRKLEEETSDVESKKLKQENEE